MILDCVKIIKDIDPDFIFTDNGDSTKGCETTNSCFIPFDKKIIVG